ncbi:peptidylprolyl isomerase [Brevundimonas sp.]|uniref:peptidylprolyl isomerase n=1 Tax=Brevundimonas sp. TaxID=1871086 RepID=UPI0025B98547|nr:peptidylprolyl isomerase [Brevundimonas sp.]
MRTVIAVAALLALASPALAQTQSPPTSAGTLNPASDRPAQPRVQQAEFQIQDGIVATVNDRVITGYDLRQRMLLIIVMSEVQPTAENIAQIQREALDMLIDEHLQAQEIAKFPSLIITDEEVDSEIAAMAQQAGMTPGQYMQALASAGIHARTVREQIRTAIGWRELVGGRFSSRARVSRSQVEQNLRKYEEAASKKQYLIGEIYIDANRVGGMQAAISGGQQLIQQMIQGAPFQAVAQQFSAAPTAVRGGDAGWVVEGTVAPALQQAFDNLDIGQLSNPIVVEGGVYIIYMRDKREGSATSLVQLSQIMVELPETASEAEVEAAAQRLMAVRPQLTCQTMVARATAEPGLLGSDLGESDVLNLAPQFQPFARSAQVGEVSEPIRTPLGLHLVGLCGRRVGSADMPTYRDVESQLLRANLSMLGRRYMRDLRADALIEMK